MGSLRDLSSSHEELCNIHIRGQVYVSQFRSSHSTREGRGTRKPSFLTAPKETCDQTKLSGQGPGGDGGARNGVGVKGKGRLAVSHKLEDKGKEKGNPERQGQRKQRPNLSISGDTFFSTSQYLLSSKIVSSPTLLSPLRGRIGGMAITGCANTRHLSGCGQLFPRSSVGRHPCDAGSDGSRTCAFLWILRIEPCLSALLWVPFLSSLMRCRCLC